MEKPWSLNENDIRQWSEISSLPLCFHSLFPRVHGQLPMEATVRWLSQSDPVPAQSDKRCRSLNIRDVSPLHRLKAETHRAELGWGTTARDIATKSRQRYQAKKQPGAVIVITLWAAALVYVTTICESVWEIISRPHSPACARMCVCFHSLTHFPVSVTSSNTLRRKKSLINVGYSSKQTRGLICEQRQKWPLKVLFCQFYTNHLFSSQNIVWN